MKKIPIILFVLISFLLLSGCAIRTPQINGLVLDEETKQPVPEAWVTSDIELDVNTVAGKVNYVFSVDQPHTRTDKDGKFVIPSQKIKGAVFPFEFGTEVRSFGVSATTSDYRGGGLEIKDKLGAWGDVKVTIYLGRLEKDEEKQIAAYMKDGVKEERAKEIIENDRFGALQALYNYCETGRFAVEVPAVEGGCDNWELDYAIKKHENYLQKYVLTDETRSHRSIILEQLGLLYEKKQNYEKAIEYLTKAKQIRFFLPQTLERKIKELQNMLGQNTK